MTRQGNRLTRFLLVEAAGIASRYDPRLKREIVLDPRIETFAHDKEANACLTKVHRKPYILHKV